MDASDDQKLPPQPAREKSDKLADSAPKNGKEIDDSTSLENSGASGVVPPRTEAARLYKEYQVHIHSYEFYLEYGLKAVAVFYAVIGGILSIYFGGSRQLDRRVLIILLGLPILMSGILGSTFLWGAYKWCKMSKHVERLAKRLRIHKTPDIVLLTYLLLIFGSLYILTGVLLGWLMYEIKVG